MSSFSAVGQFSRMAWQSRLPVSSIAILDQSWMSLSDLYRFGAGSGLDRIFDQTWPEDLLLMMMCKGQRLFGLLASPLAMTTRRRQEGQRLT